jgi:hypothetical protein
LIKVQKEKEEKTHLVFYSSYVSCGKLGMTEGIAGQEEKVGLGFDGFGFGHLDSATTSRRRIMRSESDR